MALIEWLMPGRKVPMLSESRSGMIQMLLLFVAGILFVVGFLLDIEALYSSAIPLQVVGAVILIFRFCRSNSCLIDAVCHQARLRSLTYS